MLEIYILFHVWCICCTGDAASDYTAAEQQAIVDAHNNYRGGVSPAASNMLAMVSWHLLLGSLITR
jgi:hypothetical protein